MGGFGWANGFGFFLPPLARTKDLLRADFSQAQT